MPNQPSSPFHTCTHQHSTISVVGLVCSVLVSHMQWLIGLCNMINHRMAYYCDSVPWPGDAFSGVLGSHADYMTYLKAGYSYCLVPATTTTTTRIGILESTLDRQRHIHRIDELLLFVVYHCESSIGYLHMFGIIIISCCCCFFFVIYYIIIQVCIKYP